MARAYPHFVSSVNTLGFGRPAYELMDDSNVSWNEALPEVERFAEQQGLSEVPLDWFSLSDPALVAPRVRLWNCEQPAESDAYPHQALAGGPMWASQLPPRIPKGGEPGGPPLPADYRNTWGIPIDFRASAVETERHPAEIGKRLEELTKKMRGQMK